MRSQWRTLAQEIYQRKTAFFVATIARQDLSPYTREVMQYLQSKEVEMAVVTGSTEGNAYPRIARHYADFIHKDHIITAESVTQGEAPS